MARATRRRLRRVRDQRNADWNTERLRRAWGALVRRSHPDDPPPDDEGGAGVREPRRPLPIAPAGEMELEIAGSSWPDDDPDTFDNSHGHVLLEARP